MTGSRASEMENAMMMINSHILDQVGFAPAGVARDRSTVDATVTASRRLYLG